MIVYIAPSSRRVCARVCVAGEKRGARLRVHLHERDPCQLQANQCAFAAIHMVTMLLTIPGEAYHMLATLDVV